MSQSLDWEPQIRLAIPKSMSWTQFYILGEILAMFQRHVLYIKLEITHCYGPKFHSWGDLRWDIAPNVPAEHADVAEVKVKR